MTYAEVFDSRDDAFRRERQVKGWSRAKKEALAREDWPALQRLARTAATSQSHGDGWGLARPERKKTSSGWAKEGKLGMSERRQARDERKKLWNCTDSGKTVQEKKRATAVRPSPPKPC